MPLRNIWAPGGLSTQGYQAPKVPSAPAFQNRFFNPNTPPQRRGRQSPVNVKVLGQEREFESNFFERLEYNALPLLGYAIQQPARIAERPVAALDVVTGGAVRKGIEAIGDAGGQEGKPGPIGSVLKGVGDLIYGIGNVVPSMANSHDAFILQALRNKPMDYVIPEILGRKTIDGGLLGFFGLGGRQMTKREFLDDLDKRGFFRDENTGEALPPEAVAQRAASDMFGFGYARVNDSVAVDLAFRMVTDPLNLAFFVPGGAVARVGSLAGRAGGSVLRARWASPVVTATTRTRGFGYGFVKDMTSRGLRATSIPSAAQAGRAILQGSIRDGSLKGLATAMSLAQRGAKNVFLPGLHVKSAAQLQSLGRTGLGARALQGHEFLRAYQRGALRMQIGSVTAEGASGAASDWLEGSLGTDHFATGIASAIHTTFNKINNNHPLSDNELFIITSAVALPTVSAIGEYAGFARAGAHRLIGDNDAVVFAKSLVPDLNKNLGNLTKREQTDALYDRFGSGDIELGKRVFQFMLDYLDSRRAWKEIAAANRRYASMDQLAANAAGLAPVVEQKVIRMRQMGKVNAKGRLNEMWELMRHGDEGADRAFSFNATPDSVIEFWTREFQARSKYTQPLREYGNFILKQSKIFTQEMADDIVRAVDSFDGPVPRELMAELVVRYPALLDPETPGAKFWARFATQTDEPGIGGIGLVDERVTAKEVREAIEGIRDDLPTNDEMFWEASQLEASAAQDPKLLGPLRAIKTYSELRTVRDEASGEMKGLRRDERELARLRNTEFTRNGKPKYESVDKTTGYKGTVFYKVSGAPQVVNMPVSKLVQYLEVDDVLETKIDFYGEEYVNDLRTSLREGGVRLDPDEPITLGIDSKTGKPVLEDGNTRVVLANELGITEVPVVVKPGVDNAKTAPDRFRFQDASGNHTHTWLHPDGRIVLEDWTPGRTVQMADPVTGEVTRGRPAYTSVRHSEALVKMVQMGGRTVELENPGLLGGVPQFLAAHGFREVARIDAPGGKAVAKTFYAYTGGSVSDLGQRVGSFPMPTRIRAIDAGARVYRIADEPQNISVEHLRAFVEIDRETTPKVRGDSSYLDELTETIKKSKHIEPITLTYNPTRQLASITDGNHRVAVARRLGMREIPVKVEIDLTLAEGAVANQPAAQGSILSFGGPTGVITAAELVNDIKNAFEPYRPTKRVVKNEAGGLSLAKQRADKASLTIPAGDSLGIGPVNTAGQFHGSPADFEQFSDAFRNPQDFIGAGVFMTDAFDIAQTYAPGLTKGAADATGLVMLGDGGNIYRVKPKAGINTVDLMKPMPDDIRSSVVEHLQKAMGDNLEGYADAVVRFDALFDDMLKNDALRPVVERAFDSVQKMREAGTFDDWTIGRVSKNTFPEGAEDPYGILFDELRRLEDQRRGGDTTVQPLIDQLKEWTDELAERIDVAGANSMPSTILRMASDPNATGFDLFRLIYEETVNSSGAGGAEILGELNDAVNAAFRAHGVDAYTHTGGLIAGDGSRVHGVTIVLDSKNVDILERISARDIVPHTKARFQQITSRMNFVRARIREHQKQLDAIDARADELRTVKVSEDVLNQVEPDQQQALRELVAQIREEYPMYDVDVAPPYHFDPADGVLPALNIERNLARHVLYDYGPLSRVAALWHGLFDPISSKAQSKAARQTVFNRLLPLGASVKQVEQILTRLNGRQREQVVGSMRVPWFRDITSLPANQVNDVARSILDAGTYSKMQARYGQNGFHHLLDESANEFIRTFDTKVATGSGNGALSRAMREGYRMWSYAPVVGSSSRLISKQFYHIFRFMLDLRWHFLNIVEADILSLFRSGLTRASSEPRSVSKSALMTHTTAEGLPSGIARAMSDEGPAQAMELFDAGLYLHNKNLLPVLERNYDKARLESVNAVLDDLPTSHPVIRALTERFGLPDRKSWSELLDDMMYDFDTKGVRPTVLDEFKKVADEENWSAAERQDFMAMVERISEKNQQAYDDLVGLYQGNLNRNRVERLLNSYWLYWPISYQIKATKWLFNVMFNRMGGRNTNLAGAYLVDRQIDAFMENLENDPEFARQLAEQEDLWFVAGMFFPALPIDIGVSLNRGVRYAGSVLAPEVIPPYLGVDGPEDILTRMLEMGPIYSARLLQTVVNDSKNDSAPDGPDFNRLPKSGSGKTGLDRVLGR